MKSFSIDFRCLLCKAIGCAAVFFLFPFLHIAPLMAQVTDSLPAIAAPMEDNAQKQPPAAIPIGRHYVTGTVVNEQGAPLVRVSVQIKGTSKGTVTNERGVYSIEVSDSDVLVFSYAGYIMQEQRVTGKTVIDISMVPRREELAEVVVVVGYGTQRKRDITGATATVSGADLSKQIVTTPLQALQGKAAGVQLTGGDAPGTSPQIRVRGTGTMLAGTHALYVVDGVLTQDISNINSDDITDITVLKDASATAIYGSRGANGVLIITTKKGKPGKPQVTYNGNIGVRQAANLVKMADAAEYANYYQASTGQIPLASGYSTDWYNTILRTALEQTHNISLSGGSDKTTYFFSAGYLDDDGIVKNNAFKRLTLRSNDEFKINDKIKVGIQSSFENGVNQNGFSNINIDEFGNVGSVYTDAYRAAPIIPSIVNGKYGNTSAYQNVGNPLLDLNDNSIRAANNRLQATSYLEIKPVQWITFRSSIGTDWQDLGARGYFYQFNADTTTFLTAGGNQYNAHSSLTVKDTKTFWWVWDNTLTFTRQFGKHGFNLLVGTTAEKYQQTFFLASRKDVPADPNLWYIKNGDANSSQNDGGGDAWARTSYLGRLNYNFNEKYLLTVSLRSDGSSRLPAGNRFRAYPSVGAAWVLTREAFMSDQHVVDYLKLRTSWGKVGNDQIPTDAYTFTVDQNLAYPFGGSNAAASNGSRISQFKDPNITWEETEEYDAAVEFALLRSRLTGEVDYYNKNVQNALINKLLPFTVPDFDHLLLTNAATIQNKGWEVLLNWSDKINKNFSYHIGGNITFNQNTVTSLNGGLPLPGGGIGANQGNITLSDVGHPVGSFYVLKVVGVFNSAAEVDNYKSANGTIIQPSAQPGDFKYADVNGDGTIDDSDRVFAGSYQPVAYYGINGGIAFKHWDLSIDAYGNAGNQVYNGKRAVRVQGTDNIEADLVYNRWTPSNHTQTQPAANTGNLPASTYFIESGSFIRINNITLGYTFAPELLEKISITTLRVYASTQNVFTYKKYSGFTAELPGDPLNSGIELTSYPTTRAFVIGVNVVFK